MISLEKLKTQGAHSMISRKITTLTTLLALTLLISGCGRQNADNTQNSNVASDAQSQAQVQGASSSSFIDSYQRHFWCGQGEDGTYNDAPYIDFWGVYDTTTYNGEVEVYFEVEHDGELVYTSEVTNSPDCYFYATDYTGAYLLPAGTYTVTLFTADGTQVDSDSCIVTLSAPPQAIDLLSGDIDMAPVWDNYASTWSSTITAYSWYDYNNNNTGTGYYTANDTVEFDLTTLDSDAGSLYYAYYYIPEGDLTLVDLNTPSYSATVDYTAYTTSNFYECRLENPMSGAYLIIVAESEDQWANGTGTYLCHSMCVVE